MLGIAANSWHWSPSDFWNATMHEYMACQEVMTEMNTPDPTRMKGI